MEGFPELTEKAVDVWCGGEQQSDGGRRSVAKGVPDVTWNANGLAWLCGYPMPRVTFVLENIEFPFKYKEHFRISMTVQRNGHTGWN